jgi:hypothetical protein
VKNGELYRSDDAGISSENVGGKPTHRKTEVSWGRLIRPGLVGPKVRPKGVIDGQSVNIQILLIKRYQLRQDAVG